MKRISCFVYNFGIKCDPTIFYKSCYHTQTIYKGKWRRTFLNKKGGRKKKGAHTGSTEKYGVLWAGPWTGLWTIFFNSVKVLPKQNFRICVEISHFKLSTSLLFKSEALIPFTQVTDVKTTCKCFIIMFYICLAASHRQILGSFWARL